MTIRKLLLPALLGAVLVAPAALAQSSVAAKAGVAAGLEAGPVRTQGQVGVDAAAHSDAVHQAADAARATDEQVGGTVKTVARTGAKASDKASAKAAEAVAGNARAGANAAVSATATTSAPEPEEEEEDGN